MQHTYPQIAIVTESNLLTHEEAARIAVAIDVQVQRDFGPIWFHKADVIAIRPVPTIPPNTWIIHILDTSDQEGALGYHDEDGNDVPYVRVFAQTIKQDDAILSEVISHEVLEMLVDPHANFTAIDYETERLKMVEVCDAVQGTPYLIDGIAVSDFVKPGWFDSRTPSNQQTSFNEGTMGDGALMGPWAMGSGGYISYLDLKDLNAGWQQIEGGSVTSKSGPHADRITRREIAAS